MPDLQPVIIAKHLRSVINHGNGTQSVDDRSIRVSPDECADVVNLGLKKLGHIDLLDQLEQFRRNAATLLPVLEERIAALERENTEDAASDDGLEKRIAALDNLIRGNLRRLWALEAEVTGSGNGGFPGHEQRIAALEGKPLPTVAAASTPSNEACAICGHRYGDHRCDGACPVDKEKRFKPSGRMVLQPGTVVYEKANATADRIIASDPAAITPAGKLLSLISIMQLNGTLAAEPAQEARAALAALVAEVDGLKSGERAADAEIERLRAELAALRKDTASPAQPGAVDEATDDEIPEDLARAINDARDGRAPTHEQVGVMLHYLVAGAAEIARLRDAISAVHAAVGVPSQHVGDPDVDAAAEIARLRAELEQARRGATDIADSLRHDRDCAIALKNEAQQQRDEAIARAEKAEARLQERDQKYLQHAEDSASLRETAKACVNLADTLRHLMNAQQLATLADMRAKAFAP